MTDETTDNADDAEDMAAMMAEPGGGVEPSRILNQDEIDSLLGFDEEEDDGEGGGSPCVIVVDPMDVNGRRFCDELREWGVYKLKACSFCVGASLFLSLLWPSSCGLEQTYFVAH